MKIIKFEDKYRDDMIYMVFGYQKNYFDLDKDEPFWIA